MQTRIVNSSEATQLGGGYAQAVETVDCRRLLYISGQVPEALDGTIPPDFDAQCRLAWRNVEAQLRAADMSLDNLVKATTYLSARKYQNDNSRVRKEILGERQIALTVIVAGIYDERWLLEIEAVAAA